MPIRTSRARWRYAAAWASAAGANFCCEVSDSGIGIALTKPVRQEQLHATLVHVLTGQRVRGRRAMETGRRLQDVRALVVDDHPVNRRIGLQMLQEMGCQFVGAANGAEAVELYTEEGRNFDVILMDLHMPVLDGYGATRQLRHWEREHDRAPVPIVALTATALQDEIDEAISAGMTSHVVKPYTFEMLHTAVGACVAGRAVPSYG